MDFVVFFKTAFLALKVNKLRSLLTALGIIIGVATVIAMISIIEGVNQYIYKTLGSIGSNTVYIQKFDWNVGMSGRKSSEWRELMRRRDFTVQDAEAIKRLSSVAQVAPYQPIQGSLRLEYTSRNVEIDDVNGSTPGYLEIAGHELEKGRDLSQDDLLFRRQVVILGNLAVENLFGEGEDPIGKEIYIGDYRFLIIGTLKKRGQLFGNNLDDFALIPITTAQKLFVQPGERIWLINTLGILVKVKERVSIDKTLEELENILRIRRGLRLDEKNDFALNTQQMLVDVWKKMTAGIFGAMIGIASLALLVGGIGIMNIMLVSVAERTREIGIRMAIGAKRREILIQFLIESAFLTATGGIIGVLLGFSIAKLVDILTPLPSAMPIWSVVLGIGFSAVVGLFFGIYPATKASRLDPIEALRYE